MLWVPLQGFFVFSEAEIWPHSIWNLGDFFPILKKKSPKLFFFFFFFEDWDFDSINTHTSYMVMFSLIVCVIANLFFY